ncbi:hypothetical protein EVAR_48974_1 [Eumeta japonica]|uniref:Uncharacterized protein n=1 Tax=Eumeta variegata TaxID=151549 RepID=A0A4C1Y4Y9_EUMVA|nr:hypothetical protein EVAR_48974_1 [Eumeta japonica]
MVRQLLFYRIYSALFVVKSIRLCMSKNWTRVCHDRPDTHWHLKQMLEIAFFLFRPSIETISDRNALQSMMRWKDTSADLAATFQER